MLLTVPSQRQELGLYLSSPAVIQSQYSISGVCIIQIIVFSTHVDSNHLKQKLQIKLFVFPTQEQYSKVRLARIFFH